MPKRILIVDDNDVLRNLLAQCLEYAGYTPIGAESAEAALALMQLDPPDLCVVDHMMPGMTGAELIRAMRASQDARLRALPAIGLSGWVDGEEALLEAGAARALKKPCGVEPLLEQVRELAA